jgi:hypothetical protein
MASELALRPRITLLEALRVAQDQVLVPERRREIKAWSVVQGRLEDLLNAAQAAIAQSGSSAAESKPTGMASEAESTERPRSDGDVALPRAEVEMQASVGESQTGAVAMGKAAAAGTVQGGVEMPLADMQAKQIDAAAMGAMLASVFETALLVALQSRRVEDAFAGVMARAAERSTEDRSSANRQEKDSAREIQRVLLAGFDASIAKGIEEQLRGNFDVRRWAPNHGPQMLETLTRMCSVVVIPDEADEEAGQAFSGRDLQVLRHSGNTQRLAERLSMLVS